MNGGGEAEAWRRWRLEGGRLAAFGRFLLFIALSLGLVQAALLLLPGFDTVDVMEGDALSRALLVQGTILLAAALLAGGILARAMDDRPPSWVGFGLDRRVPREIGVGLALGVAALALVVVIGTLVGGFRYGADSGSLAGWLAVALGSLAWLLIPAAAEEALFRGYGFRALATAAGPVGATLGLSALFALVHGQNPNVGMFGLVNIFLAGVLLSVAVLRTGSLWFATSLHLGWNWGMAGLLDLPVSGLDAFDAPLYEPLTGAGPEWLTGGAFGPEGGVAGTVAVLLALAMTWWMTRDGGWIGSIARERRGA